MATESRSSGTTLARLEDWTSSLVDDARRAAGGRKEEFGKDVEESTGALPCPAELLGCVKVADSQHYSLGIDPLESSICIPENPMHAACAHLEGQGQWGL